MTFVLTPIGTVRNSRTDIAMNNHWGEVTSTIVVDERFGDDCLLGLAEFSDVEVLVVFDQTTERPDHRPRRPGGVGPTSQRGTTGRFDPCTDVHPTVHNPNTVPAATPLVTGPTIRLPARHAKTRRDGYRKQQTV